MLHFDSLFLPSLTGWRRRGKTLRSDTNKYTQRRKHIHKKRKHKHVQICTPYTYNRLETERQDTKKRRELLQFLETARQQLVRVLVL
jgi:hypothetical protein